MLIGAIEGMRRGANPAVVVLIGGRRSGKTHLLERSRRLDALLRRWRQPSLEARPRDAVEGFDPEVDWFTFTEAQDAGLLRMWVDEYDGLYRAYLTDLGRARREALDG